MWTIGVDGGGTKCEAGLFDINGTVVATATTGPANLCSNFTRGIAEIEKACTAVIEQYTRLYEIEIPKSDCFLSIGCAGGSIASVKQSFNGWSHEYAGALLNSDVYVSCLAANKGKPCALFVIGTGTCLAVNEHNEDTPNPLFEISQYGGHGFLLGDHASGAFLGKQALSWYLQAFDMPHYDTALFTALKTLLGQNVNKLVQEYGQAPAVEFGKLMPALLSVKNDSPMVSCWLQEGAAYIASMINHNCLPNTSIFLTGGLAFVYKPLVEELLGKQVFFPNKNAIEGAYLASKF